MKISNPKAKYGDIVEVLNYRCKPYKWEEGEVRTVAYKNDFGSYFYWTYNVYIRRGKGLFLYVGDDKIRKIK